jgi:hypothetical protein
MTRQVTTPTRQVRGWASEGWKDPSEKGDEKDQDERTGNLGPRHVSGDDGGQQEGHHAARGVHQGMAIAQEQDGERDEDGAVEAGEDADGDVLVAEWRERQHSIAHPHRDGENGGGDPAREVAVDTG